ncbi:uncharacterized protein [Heptranchias perlo]|uniref:uncharacterized protein isoform X3 n=1 Tax=Heptranchias perlo TaxID=212740 RepID=UPI0035595567
MSKTWATPPTGADGSSAEPDAGQIKCEKIVTEELRAVPLHHRPEFVEACADLINEEWKRSKASRIHSLQKSSNGFPVCLVLIRTLKNVGKTRNETKGQLVGHSRLSHVVGKSAGLFVETVVIDKEFRGKGYGRKLMEATEAYAKLRGFKTLYLTTHDKQHFYSHLGYVLCKPVQNAGSMTTFMHMEFLERLCASSTLQPPCSSSPSESPGTVSGCSGGVYLGTTTHPTSPNSSSAQLHLWTPLPTPTPSLSPPLHFQSLLPPHPSPQVPSPSEPSPSQSPAPLISATAQINRLKPPSSSCPISSSSQSNGSITFPSSSLIAFSSQPGQLQPSVSCFSTTSQLDACIPTPPPPPPLPPPPPPLPAPPSLFSSQLHGQNLPCSSSSLSLTLPISCSSRLHSPSALPHQLSSPHTDSVTMLPAPPPLPRASETLSQLSQFPCHSDIPGDMCEPFKEEGEAARSQLETPYRDVKGLPVFWMKKDV